MELARETLETVVLRMRGAESIKIASVQSAESIPFSFFPEFVTHCFAQIGFVLILRQDWGTALERFGAAWRGEHHSERKGFHFVFSSNSSSSTI
jgi:hypothetical protein